MKNNYLVSQITCIILAVIAISARFTNNKNKYIDKFAIKITKHLGVCPYPTLPPFGKISLG
jgi:hypothetical protein